MGFDLDTLDLKQIQALSVADKKCEFCGREAYSGEMRADGHAIYWCYDCSLERGSILIELISTEQVDLFSRGNGDILSLCSSPELLAWSASASERATQKLKERRRQDGRDKDN